jgi:hypothetical protein
MTGWWELPADQPSFEVDGTTPIFFWLTSVTSIPGYIQKLILKFDILVAEISEYSKCLLSCKPFERFDWAFGARLRVNIPASRSWKELKLIALPRVNNNSLVN